jgi:hypothetical protein
MLSMASLLIFEVLSKFIMSEFPVVGEGYEPHLGAMHNNVKDIVHCTKVVNPRFSQWHTGARLNGSLRHKTWKGIIHHKRIGNDAGLRSDTMADQGGRQSETLSPASS